MNKKSIWSHLEDGFDILGGYGFPMMDKTALELNLDDGWFTWIAAIWLFGSEQITTSKFMHMFPYGLARLNEECFASAARQGYLILDNESGYSATEIGVNVAQKIWRQAGDSIADLKPMSEESLQHLLNFLERLVEASLAMPQPPAHFFLSSKKKNYQQFGTIYPLEYFVVLFGELAAYRDDMYVAAWQAYQIEGHAWDLFDKMVGGKALTIDGLYAKLKRRGLPQEIYFQDLQELIKRGWVTEKANEYQITPAGNKVREDVEAETERLFFAPWACLEEKDLEDLMNLVTQLYDDLRS